MQIRQGNDQISQGKNGCWTTPAGPRWCPVDNPRRQWGPPQMWSMGPWVHDIGFVSPFLIFPPISPRASLGGSVIFNHEKQKNGLYRQKPISSFDRTLPKIGAKNWGPLPLQRASKCPDRTHSPGLQCGKHNQKHHPPRCC